jgi:RNA polymerase primary sigma factor
MIEEKVKRLKSVSKQSKKVDIKESDPLALYLKQISNYPLLSLENEQEIGKRIQELNATINKKQRAKKNLSQQDKQELKKMSDELRDEKNKMINSNLRLVVSIAKNYQHRGLSLLDLIDEGNIGLIEAVERFDYTKKCRFSTYGTWWIRQAIIKSLADKGSVIRIPIHMRNTIKKCYFVAKHLTQELGRDPNNVELSEYMDLPVSKVKEIMKLTQETASLDTTVDDENVTRLSDLIRDNQSEEPFSHVFQNSLQDTLHDVLQELTEREKKIIQLRFGLAGEGPLTLEETGKILGITRERVRQIQEKAMSKLRTESRIKDFHDYR